MCLTLGGRDEVCVVEEEGGEGRGAGEVGRGPEARGQPRQPSAAQILLHHQRIQHLHEQPGSPAGLRGQTLQQRWLMRQGNTLMPRVEQGAAWCDVT